MFKIEASFGVGENLKDNVKKEKVTNYFNVFKMNVILFFIYVVDFYCHNLRFIIK